MRGFVEALGLDNVAVIAERAEILGRDAGHREQFDLVAARACGPLPVLVEYALPLIRLGGALLAWKGAVPADELRAGRGAARQVGGGEPEVQPSRIAALGDHSFVIVEKLHATPDRFPRRPGQPARRPLG
jgi:16S rRNA (guanine527-N7)-methyltransferase